MNRQLKIRDLLETAIRRFHAGRVEEASGFCEKVLKMDRKNPTALHLLGVVSHQAGNAERAARLLEKSLKSEPKNPDAQNYMGIVLAELGRLEPAERAFRRAVSLNPGFPEAYNNLGNTLKKKGKFATAMDSYEEALRLRPDYAEACNGLGGTLRETGEPEKAEAVLREALRIDPGHPEACLNLGNVLADLGRHDEAVNLYRQALEINPGLSDAHEYLTGALQSLGQPSETLHAARNWVRSEPQSARAQWVLGGALAAVEAFDEARAAYADALSRSDQPTLRARILFELSQLPGREADSAHLDEMQILLERVQELQAADPDTDYPSQLGFGIGALLDKLGRVEEAWQAFVTANERLDRICREGWADDEAIRAGYLDRARSWSGKLRRESATNSTLPVSLFILGPSRAGKSTIEKLAMSLEAVMPGHESLLISNCIQQASGQANAMGHGSPAVLDDQGHAAFLHAYEDAVRGFSGEYSAITYTHPSYILESGLLAETVPNARFVFVERDREDIALRIYMKLYNRNTNLYAYDRPKIEAYLDWYEAMCTAWVDVLGDGVIRVRYEDAVSQPEETRLRIARLCGLKETGVSLPELGDDRSVAGRYAGLKDANSANNTGSG